MKFRDYQAPPVGAAMTPFPYFVRPDESIAEVERLMDEHGIRHIPVQHGQRVVGIISQGDLRSLAHLPQRPESIEKLRARDLLRADPYVVEFGKPLAEVVGVMADRRIGSAIVVRHGKLAGILSVVDVCRVLAGLLEARSPTGGDEAA